MDVGAGNRHVQHHFKRLIDDAVTVDNRGRRIGPVPDAVDMRAHQPLGTGLEFDDCGIDGLDTVPVEQLGQPPLADTERAELGADIPDAPGCSRARAFKLRPSSITRGTGESDKAPDHRVYAGQRYEVGAGWLRCRLVKLEAPAEDGTTHIALWEPRD